MSCKAGFDNCQTPMKPVSGVPTASKVAEWPSGIPTYPVPDSINDWELSDLLEDAFINQQGEAAMGDWRNRLVMRDDAVPIARWYGTRQPSGTRFIIPSSATFSDVFRAARIKEEVFTANRHKDILGLEARIRYPNPDDTEILNLRSKRGKTVADAEGICEHGGGRQFSNEQRKEFCSTAFWGKTRFFKDEVVPQMPTGASLADINQWFLDVDDDVLLEADLLGLL